MDIECMEGKCRSDEVKLPKIGFGTAELGEEAGHMEVKKLSEKQFQKYAVRERSKEKTLSYRQSSLPRSLAISRLWMTLSVLWIRYR